MFNAIAGHQPIADLHTGILAKVYEVNKFDGVYLIHDLDLLEEKGSTGVSFPNANKSSTSSFSLLEGAGKKHKKKFFTHGPVTVKDLSKILERVHSFSNGKVEKHYFQGVKQRVAELSDMFSGVSYESVVEFHIDLHKFLLPRIGIDVPPIITLSNLLSKSEGKQELEKMFGLENPDLFWRLDKERCTRRRLESGDDFAVLAREKCLIPRAVPLASLLRRLSGTMIRGVGQKTYEDQVSVAQDCRVVTLTSNQGLPEPWTVKSHERFRPSALLLWLLGGQFDSAQLIRS